MQRWIPDSLDFAQRRKKVGTLSSYLGIGVNFLLALGKGLVGYLTSSIAILGDGLNNLFDSISAFVSLFSFRMADKPKDKEHPFGHARVEYIASSGVSLLILYVGITLFWESLQKVLHPEAMEVSLLQLGVLLASILLKYVLYRYYRQAGESIHSQLLLANATDSLSDILATSGIILALLLSLVIPGPMDGIMGLLVAVIILKNGYETLLSTFDRLMGTPPRPTFVEELKRLIEGREDVLGVHDIMVHDYGPGRQYVTAHVEVKATLSLVDAHELADSLERTLEQEKGIHLTLHMDPMVMDNPKVNRMRKRIRELLAKAHPSYGIHDFQILDQSCWKKITFDLMVPWKDPTDDEDLQREVETFVGALYPDFLVEVTVDRGVVTENSLGK